MAKKKRSKAEKTEVSKVRTSTGKGDSGTLDVFIVGQEQDISKSFIDLGVSSTLSGSIATFLAGDTKIEKVPFAIDSWALGPESSTRLGACIFIRSRNTAGLGYELVPNKKTQREIEKYRKESTEEENKEKDALLERVQVEKDLVEDFLDNPNPTKSFAKIFQMVIADKEGVGNGYLEVKREPLSAQGKIEGHPMELNRVFGHAIRRKVEGGFLEQKSPEEFVHYKEWGDDRVIDKKTGQPFKPSNGNIPPQDRATELIPFIVETLRRTNYGMPRHISTGPTIAGNRFASERNAVFFENDAPQPLYAKILTPNGWTTMGEVEIGTKTIGSDGEAHEVTEIIPQGMKKVYKVTFSDGHSTECTLGHLWTVSCSYDRQRGITRDMTLKEIIKGGFRYDCGTAKWAIPMPDVVSYKEGNRLPISSYLLGLLLGDGCFRETITLACWTPDADETQDLISDLLPLDVAIKRRDRGGWSELRFNRIDDGHKPNPMIKLIKELGLFNLLGKDKFIPEMYLRASVEDRIGILMGLIDSDGTISGSCVRYSTTSRKLADGIADLVGSLGGVASIKPMKNRTTLQVTICRLPEYITPALLRRKARSYRSSETPRIRSMVSAELVGVEETQCIRVDVEDNLYITDNFILTHNTPRMAIVVQGSYNLSKESRNDIKEFIEAKGKGVGATGRVMIIQAGKKEGSLTESEDVKIHFEKLTVGLAEEASFLKYQDRGDREIAEAFNLHPVFFEKDATRASANIGRSLTRDNVFEPDIVDHEYILNQTIIKAFDVKLIELRLKRPQVIDEEGQASIFQKLHRIGGITPNDVRDFLRKPRFKENWGDQPLPLAMQQLKVPEGRADGKLVGDVLNMGTDGKNNADTTSNDKNVNTETQEAVEKSMSHFDLVKSLINLNNILDATIEKKMREDKEGEDDE